MFQGLQTDLPFPPVPAPGPVPTDPQDPMRTQAENGVFHRESVSTFQIFSHGLKKKKAKRAVQKPCSLPGIVAKIFFFFKYVSQARPGTPYVDSLASNSCNAACFAS